MQRERFSLCSDFFSFPFPLPGFHHIRTLRLALRLNASLAKEAIINTKRRRRKIKKQRQKTLQFFSKGKNVIYTILVLPKAKRTKSEIKRLVKRTRYRLRVRLLCQGYKMPQSRIGLYIDKSCPRIPRKVQGWSIEHRPKIQLLSTVRGRRQPGRKKEGKKWPQNIYGDSIVAMMHTAV